MNFRIEKKFILNENRYLSVFSYLKKFNIQKLFPDRYIHSLYFDNKEYQLFYDTIEGTLPRKKIRLRKYYNFDKKNKFLTSKDISHFENGTLEEKKSTYWGRQKKIIKNNQNYITKNGIFVSEIGYLHPVIEIYYKRSYYFIKNYRITIDKDIIFKNRLRSGRYNKNIVIEFKFKPNLLKNFDTIFPFTERMSSKYCYAINQCVFNGKIF